jgi:DNA polymerase-3 subunit alpha
MASMLNNRINKWEDMTHYIAEMRVKNAPILPPDINKSESFFVVELNEDDKNNPIQPVRFGLSAIKNVGEGIVNQIIAERKQNGDYKDFIDFCERVPGEALNKRCLESLILSGAFSNLGLYRSQLMAIYPSVVKLVSSEKDAKASGQMSLFGTDFGTNVKIDVVIPKMNEYSNADKLKFEREYVGLYLSGHPLYEYSELFSQFGFNTGDIKSKQNDEKPELVTFGAIICEIKKIYTRANHEEMAILTVEDLFGTCEIMVFPKVWAKIKTIIAKDIVVKISGRISSRDGEDPIVLAENISPLTAETGNDLVTDDQTIAKKLYLRFNLSDEELKTETMKILSSYHGDFVVIIKDTSTGNTVSPKLTVRECRAIIYELNSLLGEENVVLK